MIIFTVSAKDRPGIIKSLSDTVLECDGNWLESKFSRLCGQFIGIAHVAIPESEEAGFRVKLENLSKAGINVTLHGAQSDQSEEECRLIEIEVEANDRAGIVDEIATVLASNQINIEHLETACESASMAGYSLFKANLTVSLPDQVSEELLESILQAVSDDLMVSIDV